MSQIIKVLVTGGRNYRDFNAISSALDQLRGLHERLFIIQGGAPGTDQLAAKWASLRGVPCAEVKAPWDHYPKAAGPIRNGWMLALKPDIVIAFPGGSGTLNMVRQSFEIPVPTIIIFRSDLHSSAVREETFLAVKRHSGVMMQSENVNEPPTVMVRFAA